MAHRSRFPLALILIGAALSGCAPSSTRRSADALAYLYPQGQVEAAGSEVHLVVPIRVGVAFTPAGARIGPQGNWVARPDDRFSEPQQREILRRVADAFRGLPEIAFVEILPTHNLAAGGGFASLAQIAGMYGVNLVALVSYDQVQYDDQDPWSLLYLTVVGAFVTPGERHETQTLLDVSVFDVASRALLFSGSGSSVEHTRSTPIAIARVQREQSRLGFERATDDLIASLNRSLAVFRDNAKQGTVRGLGTPAVRVSHADSDGVVRTGAGAIGGADLLLGLLLAAAALRPRDKPRGG